MLAIRMQRTGRKGHAHFRVVVQDSRKSPKSGKFVALLGSYDPHTKTSTLAKEQVETYLKNGAQPSPRVATLLKSEGVKLPKWVEKPAKKQGKIRNLEKLRANRPAGEEEAPVNKPADEAKAETSEDSPVAVAEGDSEATQPEENQGTQPEAEAKDEQSEQQAAAEVESNES